VWEQCDQPEVKKLVGAAQHQLVTQSRRRLLPTRLGCRRHSAPIPHFLRRSSSTPCAMLLRAPPHRLQPSLHHNCVNGLVAITPRCPSCNIWATPSRRPSGAQSDVPSRGHEQLFSICVWLFSRSAFLPLFSFSGLRFTSPFCREIIFAERLSLYFLRS
jgi:hypothetical protein